MSRDSQYILTVYCWMTNSILIMKYMTHRIHRIHPDPWTTHSTPNTFYNALSQFTSPRMPKEQSTTSFVTLVQPLSRTGFSPCIVRSKCCVDIPYWEDKEKSQMWNLDTGFDESACYSSAEYNLSFFYTSRYFGCVLNK